MMNDLVIGVGDGKRPAVRGVDFEGLFSTEEIGLLFGLRTREGLILVGQVRRVLQMHLGISSYAEIFIKPHDVPIIG